ncbi:hypothetical protein C4D27_18040 [Clostridium perfringens]
MKLEKLEIIRRNKLEGVLNAFNPIKSFDDVSEGAFIYHKDSVNIFAYDIFKSVEDGVVTYISSIDNKEYKMKAVNWYFYDESIANGVDEYWTPKLWVVDGIYHFVACNEEQLVECWNERNCDTISYDKFMEEHDFAKLLEVDGFEISLK